MPGDLGPGVVGQLAGSGAGGVGFKSKCNGFTSWLTSSDFVDRLRRFLPLLKILRNILIKKQVCPYPWNLVWSLSITSKMASIVNLFRNYILNTPKVHKVFFLENCSSTSYMFSGIVMLPSIFDTYFGGLGADSSSASFLWYRKIGQLARPHAHSTM